MHAYWAQFLKIAVAHLLAVASPGPDFAMVVRQSLAHGRRAALWTSLGIGSAILVHVSYALFGLGILLKANPWAFTGVKYAGAAYLAWIGFKSLVSRPRREMTSVPPGAEPEISGPTQPSVWAAWTTGALTNLFNPKATLFFVAIWASLIDPITPKLIQGAYGIWMSVCTAAWFAMVSVVFTHEDVRRAFLRGGHWIDRAMGLVLMALAAALVWSSMN